MAGQQSADYRKFAEMAASIKPNPILPTTNPGECEPNDEAEKVTGDIVSKAEHRKNVVKKKEQSTAELFMQGCINIAKDIFKETVVPALQDMASDIVSDAADRIIYGESGGRKKSKGKYSTGKISFEKFYEEKKGYKKARRRGHYDVSPLWFEDKYECDDVWDDFETFCKHNRFMTVRDYYSMSGQKSDPTDNNWGWEDIDGFTKKRDRSDGGWLIIPNEPDEI